MPWSSAQRYCRLLPLPALPTFPTMPTSAISTRIAGCTETPPKPSTSWSCSSLWLPIMWPTAPSQLPTCSPGPPTAQPAPLRPLYLMWAARNASHALTCTLSTRPPTSARLMRVAPLASPSATALKVVCALKAILTLTVRPATLASCPTSGILRPSAVKPVQMGMCTASKKKFVNFAVLILPMQLDCDAKPATQPPTSMKVRWSVNLALDLHPTTSPPRNASALPRRHYRSMVLSDQPAQCAPLSQSSMLYPNNARNVLLASALMFPQKAAWPVQLRSRCLQELIVLLAPADHTIILQLSNARSVQVVEFMTHHQNLAHARPAIPTLTALSAWNVRLQLIGTAHLNPAKSAKASHSSTKQHRSAKTAPPTNPFCREESVWVVPLAPTTVRLPESVYSAPITQSSTPKPPSAWCRPMPLSQYPTAPSEPSSAPLSTSACAQLKNSSMMDSYAWAATAPNTGTKLPALAQTAPMAQFLIKSRICARLASAPLRLRRMEYVSLAHKTPSTIHKLKYVFSAQLDPPTIRAQEPANC